LASRGRLLGGQRKGEDIVHLTGVEGARRERNNRGGGKKIEI